MSDCFLVALESPFAGDRVRHIPYGRACLLDCLQRGEAPIAPHLLYTLPGILRDDIPVERLMGMKAGFSWLDVVDYSVVYTDLGISAGMEEGINKALELKLPVFYRRLYGK